MAEKKRGPGRPPGSKNKKTAPKEESKAREKAKAIQAKRKADRRVVDEIWSIIAIALGVFLVIAIFTGGAGQFGELVGNFFKGVLGFVAYVLPFYLILFGILLFARQTTSISVKTILLAFLVLDAMTINSVRFIDAEKISVSFSALKGFYETGVTLKSGGLLGMFLGSLLVKWLGVSGCLIFTVVVTLISLLLIINTPVSRFLRKIGEKREEKRLIKENSYLDKEEAAETEKQMSVDDIPETNVKVKESPLKRKNIKIVDGNASSSYADEAVSSGGRLSAKDQAGRDKNNVLYYMSDDSLFGGTEPSGTYGLEEKEDYGHGFASPELLTAKAQVWVQDSGQVLDRDLGAASAQIQALALAWSPIRKIHTAQAWELHREAASFPAQKKLMTDRRL
ncbi:MAG: DNA translocase FtsK 4TM domain-containing protein [Anaerovoracaceae bacterium]